MTKLKSIAAIFLAVMSISLFAQTKSDSVYSNTTAEVIKVNYPAGTGLFMKALTSTNYNFGLELGYLWKTGENPEMSLSTPYIGERKDYRFGFSFGAQYFKDEYVFKNNLFYDSKGYGVYNKLYFASPVLMNFVSFNCHFKFMYTIPDGSSGHNIDRNRMVYGYGFEAEFWVTEDENVTIGFTDESDTFFSDINDSIYPSKVRFVFSFNTFF